MRIIRSVSFAITLMLLASVAGAQSQGKLKIVFHVDSADPSGLEMAFHNAHSVEMNAGRGNVKMVVVANGPAINLFLKKNSEKFGKDIEELVSTGGVEFHVCNTSLKAFGYKPSDVIDVCKVVPAGIIDIAHLELEGYAYIKP